jgi:N-acyl homoserine lactone hydrolase
LVKLAQTGNVVLSGDLAHFRENYEGNGVPTFNVNRAETLASIDRIKKLTANLKATMIIQHDPRDLGKLPAFPAAAR